MLLAEKIESTNLMMRLSDNSYKEHHDVKRMSLLESMEAKKSCIMGICNELQTQSAEKSIVGGDGQEKVQAVKVDSVGKLLLLKDGEGSSEYEGSIFEDDNTSSDTGMEDSGNNSRRSIGSPTAQPPVIKGKFWSVNGQFFYIAHQHLYSLFKQMVKKQACSMMME